MGWLVPGMSIRFVLAVVAIEAMVAATAVVAQVNCCVPLIIDPIPSYLDNGVIRVGVDLARGGTITYLSQSIAVAGAEAVNVVNSFRLGREVQQAYWSGPDNYGNPAPPLTGTSWNANAAGDTYGHPSTILEQTNDGKTIYTKTIPKQWALNDVDCECVTEQWIRLDGNAVQGHSRLTNHRSDHTQYPSHGQNLPAADTNGPFWRLLTYNGDVPYTNAPLTELPPRREQIWWWTFSATEHWAALVNDSGFGLGVFNPGVTQFFGGFAGDQHFGGPSDDPTGFIAPGGPEIIDWNIVYEYDYALVLGTLDEIRAYAVAHRPDDRPDYHFAHDRQHFSTFVNATDNGWPISGALHVNLDQADPYIIGPEQWWQAQDVPRLYITAAYHTSGTSAQIFWTVPGQGTAEERSVRFTTIPDGLYHTYTVDLSASPAYQGTITGLRFDPSEGNDPSGYVEIASITWSAPTQVVEYYYAAWDYYFETAFAAEIAALDGGAFGGVWQRTGQTFNAWPQPNAAASPTCRFFTGTFFAPKSSHFYTADAAECDGLKATSQVWQFESIAFYIPLADADGNCPPATLPLYRMYNNGMGGAPNHRYTTSIAVFNQMSASGWQFEGNRITKVFACVPQ